MIDKTLSDTISNVKFVLILLVVALHSVTNSKMYDLNTVSGSLYVYKSIRVIIGNTWGTIAIPMFFFLSGYLFFSNIEKFSLSIFKNKLTKRFYSLFIPYILWNVIAMIYFLVTKHQGEWSLHSLWDDFNILGNLHVFWDSHKGSQLRPINFPLWYMRDLMILCLFTPVIYWMNTILKWYWILIMWVLTIMIFKIPYITGFGFINLIVFSSGSYFGQKNLSLVMSRKLLIPFFVCTIALTWGIFRFPHCSLIAWLHLLFIICASFTLIKAIYVLCVKNLLGNGLHTQSTFFIYAIHILGIRTWCDSIFQNIFPYYYGNGWLLLMRFSLSVCLTILVSMSIYKLLQLTTPRLLVILCGR